MQIHRQLIALCLNKDCRENQGRSTGSYRVPRALPRRTMANEDKTRSPEGEELYTCLVRHSFLINSSIA
jgi:hypothetical protein